MRTEQFILKEKLRGAKVKSNRNEGQVAKSTVSKFKKEHRGLCPSLAILLDLVDQFAEYDFG